MEHKFGEVKRKQFDIKSSSDEYEAILRCILTGYFTNIAQIQGDGTYLNIRSKEKLTIHPTSILSVVYPEWIVYHQVIKSSVFFIHNGSQIDPEWIVELAPNYYRDKRKELAQHQYDKGLEVERKQEVKQVEEKGLVEIGGGKKKKEGFNTAVFGFKKKMNKSSLSFQEEI